VGRGQGRAWNQIPPTHETFDRYRLEAMVADSDKNWKKADSFYETAVGLTTKPASVPEQLGLLQADPRRICRGREAVHRSADL
jgi:hypothetical protein